MQNAKSLVYWTGLLLLVLSCSKQQLPTDTTKEQKTISRMEDRSITFAQNNPNTKTIQIFDTYINYNPAILTAKITKDTIRFTSQYDTDEIMELATLPENSNMQDGEILIEDSAEKLVILIRNNYKTVKATITQIKSSSARIDFFWILCQLLPQCPKATITSKVLINDDKIFLAGDKLQVALTLDSPIRALPYILQKNKKINNISYVNSRLKRVNIKSYPHIDSGTEKQLIEFTDIEHISGNKFVLTYKISPNTPTGDYALSLGDRVGGFNTPVKLQINTLLPTQTGNEEAYKTSVTTRQLDQDYSVVKTIITTPQDDITAIGPVVLRGIPNIECHEHFTNGIYDIRTTNNQKMILSVIRNDLVKVCNIEKIIDANIDIFSSNGNQIIFP